MTNLCNVDGAILAERDVPAGLVLYWTVNTVLSALQQWQLTRSVARYASPAAAPQTASAP